MKIEKPFANKELRHYVGSLFIFLLIIIIVGILMHYPVLETNKEVVMMMIGTISASVGVVISTITGSKPDDVQAMRNDLDKKQEQIDFLTKAKDDLEGMIINLQKEVLNNQDEIIDKIILKSAIDNKDKEATNKILNK
jgi:hypothetical protein